MNKSEQINELAAALCKAQSSMSGASKDATNPFFKSKYADLQSCWEAARKPLADNGLSVAQLIDGTMLETILMHSSGQWISSSATMNPVKNDPQGMGSCISYFRRYALSAILGLYQVDDDGQVASQPVKAYNQPIPQVNLNDSFKKTLNTLDKLLTHNAPTVSSHAPTQRQPTFNEQVAAMPKDNRTYVERAKDLKK